MVFAEEDLLGERLRRQPVPAQVEISEEVERQVLKGPEIVPWFHIQASLAIPSSIYQACNVLVQLFRLVTYLSAICTILLFRSEMELTGIGGNTSMDVILLSELDAILPLREFYTLFDESGTVTMVRNQNSRTL